MFRRAECHICARRWWRFQLTRWQRFCADNGFIVVCSSCAKKFRMESEHDD